MSAVETMPTTRGHTQVQGSHAWADEKMMPLLELLWEQGYATEWSCQGGRPVGEVSDQGGAAMKSLFRGTELSDAHIVFASFDDAARFLKEATIRFGPPKPLMERNGTQYYVAAKWAYMSLHSMTANEGSDEPRAQVFWRHDVTEKLIEVFGGDALDEIGQS